MNRIVREHYPVSKLPEDLREQFAGQQEVTVTVETSASREQPDHPSPVLPDDEAALTQLRKSGIQGGDFSSFKHLRRANYQSSAEIDAYLDELRGEWAHRER